MTIKTTLICFCALFLASCGGTAHRTDPYAHLKMAQNRTLALQAQIDSLRHLESFSTADSVRLDSLKARLAAEEANLANIRAAQGMSPPDHSVQRQFNKAQKEAEENRALGRNEPPSLDFDP